MNDKQRNMIHSSLKNVMRQNHIYLMEVTVNTELRDNDRMKNSLEISKYNDKTFELLKLKNNVEGN